MQKIISPEKSGPIFPLQLEITLLDVDRGMGGLTGKRMRDGLVGGKGVGHTLEDGLRS